MTDDLQITTDDGVLRMTMERPESLNAITAQMSDRIAEELEAAGSRDDVRVVLLTGGGDAFSSGADLSGVDAHEDFDVSALDRANRIIRAIVRLDKPVVAGVNGIAAGVGCSTALACDLVVAKQSAAFLLAFARIGLMPDGGATATVAAAVGRARAMRMALLGEVLSAGVRRRAGEPPGARRRVRPGRHEARRSSCLRPAACVRRDEARRQRRDPRTSRRRPGA
jgi:enoyl-CoA hydratase